MFKDQFENKMVHARHLIVVTLLAVSLSACGFHLRGNIPLSDGIKNMYVIAPEGTFKEQLEDILTKAGAQIADTKGGGDVVLKVTEADVDRTVGTLDERGKANSYKLRFKVTYALEDLEGQEIRGEKSVNENRRYDFNPEDVVASESEEAELLESMEQDAALSIVRQLATITDYPSK